MKRKQIDRIISILFVLVLSITSGSVSAQKKNISEIIFETEGDINVIMTTDLNYLAKKSSKEEYQEAGIQFLDSNGDEIFALPGRIRARGNMRKQQCRYPPIKIDFKKGDLEDLGYKKGIDKLKMVIQCKSGDDAAKKLKKEHLIYDIYKIIDQRGINTKLANVTFINPDGKKTEFVGFFVEEEEAYSKRIDGKIVEAGKLRAASLERDLFLKMNFFQYMIANTDFSIYNFHNLEIVKFEGDLRPTAIPYDFDYSGFVGQVYAVPHESLPITEVRQRYMFPFARTEKELNAMVEYFLSIENEVYAVIDGAYYLNEKDRKKSKQFFEPFFDKLRKPKGFVKNLIK